MMTRIGYGVASVVAVGLMVAALWAWGQSASLTAYTTRPEVAQWGVRSAAVAAGASAQLVLLSWVARGQRRRGFGRDLTRIAIGLAGSVALVSAVALGLAGR